MMSFPHGDKQIVAILHDKLKDTPLTVQDLANQGFSREIITAMGAITRKENKSYGAYIDQLKRNRLAAIVKLAELHDKADLSCFENPGEEDNNRVERYKIAMTKLAWVIGTPS